MKTELSEQEIRALRDKVFGVPISDAEWEKCKAHWTNDTEWLLAQTESQN